MIFSLTEEVGFAPVRSDYELLSAISALLLYLTYSAYNVLLISIRLLRRWFI